MLPLVLPMSALCVPLFRHKLKQGIFKATLHHNTCIGNLSTKMYTTSFDYHKQYIANR